MFNENMKAISEANLYFDKKFPKLYVFCPVENGKIIFDEIFDSYNEAVTRAICDEKIAVLDPITHEFYGII